MLKKLRGWLERFFPHEPITISFSRFRAFVLFLLVAAGALFFYLRSQNKSELEFLKQKHKEIQLAVRGYLNRMTHASVDESKSDELRRKIEGYKKQLENIEEKINNIKSFWFLE